MNIQNLTIRMSIEATKAGAGPVDFALGHVEYQARLLAEECRDGARRFYPFHTASGEQSIVEVVFPAGIRSNDYVVLVGRGGPAQGGHQRGDLYVRVVLWPAEEQRESSTTGYRTLAAAQRAASGRDWPALRP